MPPAFKVPLPIPPVKTPLRTQGGVDYYRVVQRKASLEILPGLKTEILGYDGLLPGPTFDVRGGRTTVIEQVNQLDVPTVVTQFPRETVPATRALAERMVDLRVWQEPDSGGHFGAWESPAAFVEGIRAALDVARG